MSFDDLPLVATDPKGRVVLLTEASWNHIYVRRPQLLNDLSAIIQTIENPELHEMDWRADRERFYRSVITDKIRWLRVVVDFSVEPAVVLTAFVQRKNPA